MGAPIWICMLCWDGWFILVHLSRVTAWHIQLEGTIGTWLVSGRVRFDHSISTVSTRLLPA